MAATRAATNSALLPIARKIIELLCRGNHGGVGVAADDVAVRQVVDVVDQQAEAVWGQCLAWFSGKAAMTRPSVMTGLEGQPDNRDQYRPGRRTTGLVKMP